MVDKTIDYFGIRAAEGEPVEPRVKRQPSKLKTEISVDIPGWGSLFRKEGTFPKKQTKKFFSADDPEIGLNCARFKRAISRNIFAGFKKQGYSCGDLKLEDILGVSLTEFIQIFEAKMESWMNIENYGSVNGRLPTDLNQSWDIEHSSPISNARSREDLINLNHHSNLRPFCSYKNRFLKRGRNDFNGFYSEGYSWATGILRTKDRLDSMTDEIHYFLS